MVIFPALRSRAMGSYRIEGSVNEMRDGERYGVGCDK